MSVTGSGKTNYAERLIGRELKVRTDRDELRSRRYDQMTATTKRVK